MYDVIIVGARCAGAALALSLAREGLRVLMIDRARFPSDTMSGHFIQVAGVSALNRLGLLPQLEALGAPPVRTMSLDFGPVVLKDTPVPAADGLSVAYAPRRTVFDAMLIEAARAAGAELREETSLAEIVEEAGRVAGIRVTTPAGGLEELRARIVVGADGKRSRLAAQVRAGTYDSVPAAGCTFYGYWQDLPVDGAELRIRDGLFSVATPTNDGLTFLAFAWRRARFAEVRADVPAAYAAAAARFPDLADRLAGARQVGRFTGTAETEGFFRRAWGPGWALLGDAGYHKDPITAQGMTDALLHAEILAEAIRAGLGGSVPLATALGVYAGRRDALALPLYAMTADLARLDPPPPEAAALIGALQGNGPDISAYLGLMAGTVQPDTFFAPQNVARIMGHAQPRERWASHENGDSNDHPPMAAQDARAAQPPFRFHRVERHRLPRRRRDRRHLRQVGHDLDTADRRPADL